MPNVFSLHANLHFSPSSCILHEITTLESSSVRHFFSTAHMIAGADMVNSLFNDSTELLLLLAPDGRIIKANGKAREYFGHTSEEFAGLSIRDVISLPEVDDPSNGLLTMSTYAHRVAGRIAECKARRSDGSEHAVECVLIALEDGPASNVIAIAHRAQSSHASEYHPRDIMYSLQSEGSAMYLLAVNWVSHAAYDATGHAPHEFVEDPGLWFAIIHPSDSESLKQSTASIFENRVPGVRRYRIRSKHASTPVHVEDYVFPQIEGGTLRRIIGIAHQVPKE